MITNNKSLLIVGIALALIFVLCISWLSYDEYIDKDYQYTIPKELIEPLFGCDINSFSTADLDVCDEVKGFNSKWYIDKNGDLVVQLTKHQNKKLLKSKWIDPQIDVDNNQYNFEISNDSTVLTLYVTSEMLKPENATELEIMSIEGDSIWWKMYVIHRNIQYDPIITYRLVNSDTGEVIGEVN